MNTFLSGFRSRHSTEMALLRVLNGIYLSIDSGDPVALVLLDLTAAFDTVNHSILNSYSEHCMEVFLSGSPFLTNQCFAVSIDNLTPSTANLTCGVPQASVLAPIFFSLYMLPLCNIFDKHGISFHCIANNTQIYKLIKKGNTMALDTLIAFDKVDVFKLSFILMNR